MGNRMTIVLAGAMLPRTRQYGVGETGDAPVPAGTIVADVMVTGTSVTPVRSSWATAAQSITGGMPGRFASPEAAFALPLAVTTTAATASATTSMGHLPELFLRS